MAAEEQLMTMWLNPDTEEIEARPMTPEEVAELNAWRAAAQPETLNLLRIEKTDAVQAALTDTDKWAARAVEDGTKMAPERIAYRQALRALLATIKASADPASIEIPPPPA